MPLFLSDYLATPTDITFSIIQSFSLSGITLPLVFIDISVLLRFDRPDLYEFIRILQECFHCSHKPTPSKSHYKNDKQFLLINLHLLAN